MPDRPWKAEERQVAALFGGTRFPANTGGPVGAESWPNSRKADAVTT
mgnify:CR=1 FL=1